MWGQGGAAGVGVMAEEAPVAEQGHAMVPETWGPTLSVLNPGIATVWTPTLPEPTFRPWQAVGKGSTFSRRSRQHVPTRTSPLTHSTVVQRYVRNKIKISSPS